VSRSALAASLLALAVHSGADVSVAEIQILAGGGMTVPLTQIAARFEAASGHTVVIRFGTTPELVTLATGGSPFDAAVVPREVMQDAAARARFAPAPTIDVARVGLGVAVRAGAPTLDISTPEALAQTLLRARSIATIPASAAGAQVLRVFDRLGITEAIKPKIAAQAGPAQIVQAVANGDAELGVFLINVLTAPGLDVLGPFPPEVQQEVVYTAAVAASAKAADPAAAFIAYIRSPAGAAVIRASGMKAE